MLLRQDDHDWYRETGRSRQPTGAFDAVLMRRTRPSTSEYLTATWLLERQARPTACASSAVPRPARPFPEKLAIMGSRTSPRPPSSCPRGNDRDQRLHRRPATHPSTPSTAWAAARFSGCGPTTRTTNVIVKPSPRTRPGPSCPGLPAGDHRWRQTGADHRRAGAWYR